MSKRKRMSQVCMATARDGTRCGRYAKLPLTVCSTHDPARKAVGVIALQDTNDLPTLLARLTKDRDPAIRLRAIEAVLKRQEQGCPVRASASTRAARMTTFVAALTENEKIEATTLTAAWKAFVERVYDRDDALRPDNWTPIVMTPAFVYVPPLVTDPVTPAAPPAESFIMTLDGPVVDDGSWKPL
jgi:hypothetical protein